MGINIWHTALPVWKQAYRDESVSIYRIGDMRQSCDNSAIRTQETRSTAIRAWRYATVQVATAGSWYARGNQPASIGANDSGCEYDSFYYIGLL